MVQENLNLFLRQVGHPVTRVLEMDGILKAFCALFWGQRGCVWNCWVFGTCSHHQPWLSLSSPPMSPSTLTNSQKPISATAWATWAPATLQWHQSPDHPQHCHIPAVSVPSCLVPGTYIRLHLQAIKNISYLLVFCIALYAHFPHVLKTMLNHYRDKTKTLTLQRFVHLLNWDQFHWLHLFHFKLVLFIFCEVNCVYPHDALSSTAFYYFIFFPILELYVVLLKLILI